MEQHSILVSQPAQIAAIQSSASELEAYIKGPVQAAVGRRLAYYETLCSVGESKLAAWIGPADVQLNQKLDQDARNLARSLRALDEGRVVLVPWLRDGSREVQFAIVQREDAAQYSAVGLSGLWTVLGVGAALVLVVVAPELALIGAGIYLIDAYVSYKTAQVAADAALARTKENLSAALRSAQQRGDTAQVTAITQAMQAANTAAASSNPSWIDSIINAGKAAAAGAAGGAGVLALLFFLMSRREQRS